MHGGPRPVHLETVVDLKRGPPWSFQCPDRCKRMLAKSNDSYPSKKADRPSTRVGFPHVETCH